jgi:hypothetical protein
MIRYQKKIIMKRYGSAINQFEANRGVGLFIVEKSYA